MKTRVLSILILFLLITSVSIPVVSAETPREYYQLHDMCVCEAKEDLGHIPHLNWGIGYKAWIDKKTDKWIIFIHTGLAKKHFEITPNTNLGELTALLDFIEAVDTCRSETDQIPMSIIISLGSGTLSASGFVYAGLLDNGAVAIPASAAGAEAVNEIMKSVTHWNNAKEAQKNAEKLFVELCHYI